jgi:MFS family permease
LAIAPGPFVALLWSINAGGIGARLGRRLPAIVGAACLAGAGACWVAIAPSQPDYLAGFLPGLVLAGCAAGLVQAPLFAAASDLPVQRATTGSAVLNTARQVGSAVGVALVVVLLGKGHAASLGAFHRGWGLVFVAGVSAALTVGFSIRPIMPSSATS